MLSKIQNSDFVFYLMYFQKIFTDMGQRFTKAEQKNQNDSTVLEADQTV